MKKPKRQILRGSDLLQALKAMRSDYTIKMMVWDKVFHISVKMAISIVRTSTYEGEFRRGYIVKMREIDNRISNAHDHKFRDGRACLQFVAISPKTVDLWDKSFSRIQPVP